MDDYILTEEYSNHETLGQLTIRKVGNVLTGYKNGQFQYEQANLAGLPTKSAPTATLPPATARARCGMPTAT